MLIEIKSLIDNKEYEKADRELTKMLETTDEDTEQYSHISYIKGCLNSDYRYKNRNEYIAKNSLMRCINSKYSIPSSYCRYAEIEQDVNIAINYLRQGLEKFPNDTTIYRTLLNKTKIQEDKLKIIEEINSNKLVDYNLFAEIIQIYLQHNEWGACHKYAKVIIKSFKLDDDEFALFNLIFAISILSSSKEIDKIETILKNIIKKDINNKLQYAPYIALIWFYIIKNNKTKAIYYFDKVPFCGLGDYENPWFINIDFERIYKKVLDCFCEFINDDKIRKQKANALYSIYICKREQYINTTIKIKKKDINILKKTFSEHPRETAIGVILFNSEISLNLRVDAFKTALSLYNEKPKVLDEVDFSEVFDNINVSELSDIVQELLIVIPASYISKVFIHEFIDKTIRCLYHTKYQNRFQLICNITDLLTNKQIQNSHYKFEIAYSYKAINKIDKAENIYKMELNENPESPAVLNNLGVIYKENKEYEKALQYFLASKKLDPSDEICARNYDDTNKKIKDLKNKKYKCISSNLNIEYFESIGYNEHLINHLRKIREQELQEILIKDIEECAINIATNQNKSAIILCGSILEAILLNCLLEKNIKKGIIGKTNKNVKDMSLNELLLTAQNENIISKTTYNLSNFIKDYRNIIHPSNLLRNSFKISNERVMVIWNILKELIESLLK